ncbi:AEL224Wp [Eremothecium gossypii ATCC 10895]|uniref:AEL224Wp n=1 Tax=Eremothecium gossypii (strain ATCC 10895 / CBS 109.51 / FGSC 9923 / NRRL Y-1056) TaxID=284811 RepID=Q758I6_EREGS|nr:AEL224Wp [Eremothecium gossypii ATCC 10895]AAS52461.2 AEL224Wp [Eremothecium gossypii ATCC 10895]
MTTAEEYKKEGNSAFAAKDFEKAIELFGKAIEVSEQPNHVLYSNRSACYASMRKFREALADAQECVRIKPDWSKGHNRLGAAHYGLGDLDEAEESYKKALELDSSNKAAQDGLAQVQATQQQRMEQPDLGFGQMFQDPNLIQKLKNNPKTAEMMKDPQLVAKVLQFQSNPQAISTELMRDPRLMTVMAAILGIDLSMDSPEPKSAAPADAPAPSAEQPSEAKPEPTPAASQPAPAAEKEEEPEQMHVDDDRSKAEEAKAKGNELYKKRQFDEAIANYEKAWDLHKDITYLNNRAAAEYEKGDYESAIKTLEKAVEEGRELRADYKVIAKSFARLGNAHYKLADLKKAIEYYEKSLTEHRTPEVLNKLRSLEKEQKKREAEAYIDPEKAEEARLQGKEYFTNADWPNAVKAYTEMIKRAPEDARGYSNRAAALAKLMSFPDAIKDCDMAIQKDPNFVRAYIRKATAQIAVQEYAAAIETLDTAREKDAEVNNGSNTREIDQLYIKATQQRFQPANANESPEETYARAVKDPEVAAILQDPVMQSILSQAQQNPAALQEHMKNPQVFKKIQTLIAAGIIRTR